MKKISDKDKKAWIKFIESKDKVYNKDNQNIKNKIIRIEKTIDLHGFTLEKANLEIDRFISCMQNSLLLGFMGYGHNEVI